MSQENLRVYRQAWNLIKGGPKRAPTSGPEAIGMDHIWYNYIKSGTIWNVFNLVLPEMTHDISMINFLKFSKHKRHI